MADNEQESSMMAEAGNHALDPNTVIETAQDLAEAESESVSEDILHQAFVEAEDFDHSSVPYTVQSDDVTSVTQEIVNTVVTDSSLDPTTATHIVTADGTYATTTYRVVGTLRDGTISIPDELIAQAASASDSTEHVVETSEETTNVMDSVEQQTEFVDAQEHDDQQLQETVENETCDGEQSIGQHALAPVEGIRFTLVTDNQANSAPLGSSQNPIRIIQQGNQYTPVQQLTTEQLQQIMQVVRQQQLARNTQESGASILFNTATNTRIVYRVIYPSELHKGQQSVQQVTSRGTSAGTSAVQIQQTVQMPKRQYRKRGREDEDDKVDGPELSKEEKEERKKHRPRTRSGRVSKPPKHMVKDYKHIHVLDWDEDYDDSDGGYSDYKNSDEEGKERTKERRDMSGDSSLNTGLGSTRPKNYRCQQCDKSYIGRAGLGRHYRLNPSHGSLPEETPEEKEKANGLAATENSSVFSTVSINNTSTPAGTIVVTGASSVGSSIGNLSEDSNTQDSIPSSTGATSPVTTRTRRPYRGRGGYRGRWAYYHQTAPLRRKQKLKELIKTCEDEDLMEVVLPRLVKVITPWEFMLMKIESDGSAQPRVDQIYREFYALHKHVRRVCQECLHPSSCKQNGLHGDNSKDSTVHMLKLEDAAVAQSLGFETGMYEVREMPEHEQSPFRYKYLTSDPNGPAGTPAENRTIQVVTPEELVSQQPSRRQKVTSLLNPSGTTGLVPATVTASSLLTSIASNQALTGNVVKQEQSKTGIMHSVAIQHHGTPAKQSQRQQQQRLILPGSSVSILNTASRTVSPRSVTTVVPANQQVIMVKSASLHSPQILAVSSPGVSSNPPSSTEIPLSQAANLVTVVPSTLTSNSLSLLQQTSCDVTSDISSMAPVDFMDTSGDSPVSSVSCLSSANSSGVIAVVSGSSLPNGLADSEVLNMSGRIKINGVSERDRVLMGSVLSDIPASSDCGDSVLLTSNAQDSSSSSGAINSLSESNTNCAVEVKCENGDMYATDSSCHLQVLQQETAETTLITNVDSSEHITSLDGQLNGDVHLMETENCVQDMALEDPHHLMVENSEGQVVGEDEGEGVVVATEQQASLFQTEDGILIIQNPDGTTFQLQGAQGIPLETVQALLAMEGHFESGDQIQTELQQ
ncbi:uncharacterized protein LOC112570035 isoform X2 [Pomacea canaliculata]|uniref:uncharacterized protein LOC112570035 isoform X2 n=1 Tax=Pomacea canaliculata TaxID=400727 RepID=UPI000D736D1C|nr:uncharacterized protein LOC112570035 isoform X2 [Pomacea canaliculata]